jgi:hypothetical protein
MEVTPEHFGDYKSNSEEFGYGTIVISGPIQGRKNLEFGRLIQVRKQSGAYGSDTVLIRQSDSKLYSYHNMGFFSVKPEYQEMYEEAMKYSDDQKIDNIGDTYDIQGVNPASGFVVNGLDDTNGKIYSFTITKDN